MSHYVIKLKESWSNYLAELPDYKTPQWQPRAIAKRFATKGEAWTYLDALHARGLDYPAHVVYLRTADDLKAERKALRDALAWTVDVIDHEVRPPESCGGCGTPNAQCGCECVDAVRHADGMRKARALLAKRALPSVPAAPKETGR